MEYFISACVGEMPPADPGTDKLAHLQKAGEMHVRAYEHRFHCSALGAACVGGVGVEVQPQRRF